MISYTVFQRDGRPFFEVQWVDPVSGNKRTRSTKKARKADADKWAAKHIADLEAQGMVEFDRVLWATVENRYSDEVLPTLAKKTGRKTRTMFKALRKHINPKLLISLNAVVISRFSKALRETGIRPATVCGYLGELRKVLNWADRQGLIKRVPAIEFPPADGMKGRPLTTEEFERYLSKVPDVLKKVDPEPWRHLARGLWLSGLRLEEAMSLHWTLRRDAWVDLAGRHPAIVFRSHAQKSREDEVCPITPDFAEFLLSTPEADRDGFVFNPLPFGRRSNARPKAEWVGKILTRIGEKARIKVAEWENSEGETEIKWASAHDFRRSSGSRWSLTEMPAVLQRLMRHKSIQTTMKFYVRHSADAMSAAIRGRPATEVANTRQIPPDGEHVETSENTVKTRQN